MNARRRLWLVREVILALAVGWCEASVAADDQEAAPAEAGDAAPTKESPYTETVVVTASRNEALLLESPVSVTVVTRDAVEASAGGIADLLRGVPGLNVVQVTSGQVEIAVRGPAELGGRGQLALIDGRPMNEPINGQVLWQQLPVMLDELEQVEILRGPGSSAWGPDALRGVLNLRTRSPREMPGGRVEVGAGEVGARRIAARWAEAHGRASYRVAGEWLEQDAWKRAATLPDGRPLLPAFSFPGAGTRQPRMDFRLDWEPVPGEPRTWSYRVGHAGLSGQSMSAAPTENEPGTSTSYADWSHRRPNLEARFTLQRLEGTARSLLDGSRSSWRILAPSADVSAQRILGKRQILVFGGTTRWQSCDVDAAPTASSRFEAGAWVEDQVLLDHVHVHLGVRLDHVDTFGLAISPRLGLVLKLRPRHSLRISASKAFRGPSLLENHLKYDVTTSVDLGLGVPFPLPVSAVGNPDLAAIRSLGLEVGWTGRVGSSDLGLAAYQVDTEDETLLVPVAYYSSADPPPGWPLPPDLVPPNVLAKTYRYQNLAGFRTRGLEASVATRWSDKWTTEWTWTWQDPPRVDGPPGARVNVPPRHLGSVRLRSRGARLDAAIGVTWSADARWTDVPNMEGDTDDYLLVDGSLSLHLGKAGSDLRLEVTNLLDDPAQQHLIGDVIRRQAMVSWRCDF